MIYVELSQFACKRPLTLEKCQEFALDWLNNKRSGKKLNIHATTPDEFVAHIFSCKDSSACDLCFNTDSVLVSTCVDSFIKCNIKIIVCL